MKRLSQRLPRQRGALYTHGEFTHALEDLKFAEFIVWLGLDLGSEQFMQAVPKGFCIRSRTSLDLLRHHRGGGHAERTTAAREGDVCDVIVYAEFHMQRDFVTAAWIVAVDMSIGFRQFAVVAGASGMVEHDVAIEFVKVHG